MNILKRARIANARRLMEEAGGPGAFARRIERDTSYVSQIIGPNPRKGIGDKLARAIETAFRKPEGWLDVTHESSADAPMRMAAQIRDSTPRQQITSEEVAKPAFSYDERMKTKRVGVARKDGRLIRVYSSSSRDLEYIERALFADIDSDKYATVIERGNAHHPDLGHITLAIIDMHDSHVVEDGALYAVGIEKRTMLRVLSTDLRGMIQMHSLSRGFEDVVAPESIGTEVIILGKVVRTVSVRSW